MVTATPTISSLGTNTGLTYNFTTGFSGFGAGVVGTVLSTLLSDFEGELKSNHGTLHWATTSENNSSGFYIERSNDGMHFTTAGYVGAAGNSSATITYSFVDPVPAADENYYRLREVDNDNQFQYSKTLHLTQREAGNNFKILQNPFVNRIDVLWEKPITGKVKARLMDVTGKELLAGESEMNAKNIFSLDLSGRSISAGIYLLEITLNGQHRVERVLKQ